MTVDRTPADLAGLADAYAATYHGQHGQPFPDDADGSGGSDGTPSVSPELIAAQERLAHQRRPDQTLVQVYDADEPGGFGPAIQIVTEQATALIDSVTVLLHRLGVAYVALMHPLVHVRRDDSGVLIDATTGGHAPPDCVDESWIHVQLSPSVDQRALTEAARLLPLVVADARQVARDSGALAATLAHLADDIDADDGTRFAGPDRSDVAALLRWLGNGHYVVLGALRCTVGGESVAVDEASRLGVARLRTELLPQLTDSGDLLMLAQATMPSFLRYGAFPYIVAVREQPDVEHRFVGLFTVSALNENVLDIPLLSRRVQQALALSEDDPSHPGQLMLDVIQTMPRAELFALSSEQLLTMASQVIDLGSRRRALLFARADQFGHFVSCLVYLPRDRYTTAVRLNMQQILLREFGGSNIDYAARVSESLWAVVHFTVRLPDSPDRATIDTSEANRVRIQDLLTAATRTWSDRLLGAGQVGRTDTVLLEHYAEALPEEFKQAVTPDEALNDIGLIEAVAKDSVILQLEPGDFGREVFLTWYLGDCSASLSELLPMLQSMGVEVLEQRPFTVSRRDGLEVWIYQFKIRPESNAPAFASEQDWDATAARFTDAVTAIWHGRAEVDRFNELVLRAGMTWQQVTVIRAYAKYLRQAGFSYSQSHIESVLNGNTATARSR
ncbi:MAG: NAD-glutamate dehydrogenase, partial [Mycobacteriaceae bacterium]|nr:NAD-glutamate dehydrogenase [Mycobacteriaceae bacterium]